VRRRAVDKPLDLLDGQGYDPGGGDRLPGDLPARVHAGELVLDRSVEHGLDETEVVLDRLRSQDLAGRGDDGLDV